MADGEGATELVNADVGGISFNNVRFGYGPDRDILKGLTFEASWGWLENWEGGGGSAVGVERG